MRMFRAIIGIDPGKKGGIALLHTIPGWEFWGIPMPLVAGEINRSQLADTFKQYSDLDADVVFFVERATAMPKQGVTSMFNYGMGYGVILGILEALGLSFQVVAPKTWKNVVLKGTKRDKNAAVEFCRNRYRSINLFPGGKTKPHDGIADAVCIAEYGRMITVGNNNGRKTDS